MRLQAHGIETDLPPGWEGRIKLRGRPRAQPEGRAEPATPQRRSTPPTPMAPRADEPEAEAEGFETERFEGEPFEGDRDENGAGGRDEPGPMGEDPSAEELDGYDAPVVDPDAREPFGQLEIEDDTGPTGNPGEEPNPVVHLANFALPEDRGDFGSGAVDIMTAGDILVVLFEYGPESAGTALFRQRGIPTQLTPAMFSAAALQRSRPDQAGCQLFFSVENRAFCCYTVLGRQANANRLLPEANATLAATRIAPR